MEQYYQFRYTLESITLLLYHARVVVLAFRLLTTWEGPLVDVWKKGCVRAGVRV